MVLGSRQTGEASERERERERERGYYIPVLIVKRIFSGQIDVYTLDVCTSS